jgi:hypothetical protein
LRARVDGDVLNQQAAVGRVNEISASGGSPVSQSTPISIAGA